MVAVFYCCLQIIIVPSFYKTMFSCGFYATLQLHLPCYWHCLLLNPSQSSIDNPCYSQTSTHTPWWIQLRLQISSNFTPFATKEFIILSAFPKLNPYIVIISTLFFLLFKITIIPADSLDVLSAQLFVLSFQHSCSSTLSTFKFLMLPFHSSLENLF